MAQRRKLPPIHPGELLRDELNEIAVSLNELGRALRVPMYEVLPAVIDMELAMAPGAPVIHDESDSTKIYDAAHNIAGYILREIGSVEQGFRESDFVIEREFR